MRSRRTNPRGGGQSGTAPEPMLATLVEEFPLVDAHLIYEPKYDGIRVIAEAHSVADRDASGVRLWSRLGNDKTAQFPSVARALAELASAARQDLVVDGELVAFGAAGELGSFEAMQQRMHVARAADVQRLERAVPVAFVLFDLLRVGEEDLRPRPLAERRARLEALLPAAGAGVLRLGRSMRGDGRALWEEAAAQGWEGIVAKDARSPYRSGRRSGEWRKWKRTQRQELVVGGYTEPRGSREGLGALLVGAYDDGQLVFAGGVGSGFDAATLKRLYTKLKPLEQAHCPFRGRPETLETPHWVRPKVVVDVRYSSWTDGGQMRHPVFLGERDDIAPEQVRRELPKPPTPLADAVRAAAARSEEPPPRARLDEALTALLGKLDEIEAGRGSGRITLPEATVLEVSNLNKVFWPKLGLTKGALMRYYVRVAPYIVPVVAERPLVMQRFPDGVEGEAFYQHRAPPKLARGVRVVSFEGDDVPARLVGGSLLTLLYMVQLGVISQDPWFSKVGAPELADEVALDLDPMPDVPFERVRDVALWLRDELSALDVPMFLKTSGSSGLHIFLPIREASPYERGRLFIQIIAAIVARQHPDVATVERVVGARGPKVYIDCLQNIQGKTLACAYSARANAFAGASTPLTWAELEGGARPEDFTIVSLPERLERVGDLWAGVRGERRLDIAATLDRLRRRFPGSGSAGPRA